MRICHVSYMNMVQRTMKVRLNCFEEQDAALRETTDQFTASFNHVCATGWERGCTNGIELHKLTYYDERAISDLPSQLVCQARVKATEALKSVIALDKKGKKVSCPSSDLCPIRYDTRSANIKLRDGKVSLSSIRGRQHLTFTVAPFYNKYLDWKVCTADLCFGKKGRLFLHIVVNAPNPQIVPTGYMTGVDLGVKRAAVTSDNNFFGQRRWREIEERTFRLRRKLQAKGTKSAKRHLKKLGRRLNSFRKDCDHVLSKQIVESVEPGATIVLEDLTDIRERVKTRRKQRRRLHSWSFARLKSFLLYKSLARGVCVAFVDPRYTSQKCSKCGHISRSNRRSQSEFCCTKCGFLLNADLNAARNIRDNHLASSAKSEAGGLPVNQPIVGDNVENLRYATHKPKCFSLG